jgi:hypothetical protein
MQARMYWLLAAMAWYGVIGLAHRVVLGEVAGGSGPAFRWVYGAGFVVLGVLLLGAVARWWKRGSPALWRPIMLSVGSLAAAAELASVSSLGGDPLLDLWMTALLGLLAAAILARLAPARLSHQWLGLDRRDRGPGR